MKKLLAKKVDAFTDTPLQGNPAGVVHGADSLSTETMQRIAREFNLSETAFILSPEEDGCDIQLRYFTPQEEVDMCGHATLASYHSLVEEGILKVSGASSKFKHHNKAGTFEVEVRPRGAFHQILMQMERPSFNDEFEDTDKLAKALGITEKQFRSKLPVQIMNEKQVIIPVDGLSTVEKLEPDFPALAKLGKKGKLRLRFLVLTTETHDMGTNYHIRYFAPSIGVDEDPVTGVGHAAAGAYMVRHKLAKATTGGVTNLTGEQGHFVQRPGKASVEVRSEGLVVRDVRVGGSAVTTLRGELTIG
ncbi:MAG: PhzF family phenazine biosynthesis protein [Halobacteriales archaeon]|nr:PhzF family phenazine biosynthesis protein [Halobacteriales archaeon]